MNTPVSPTFPYKQWGIRNAHRMDFLTCWIRTILFIYLSIFHVCSTSFSTCAFSSFYVIQYACWELECMEYLKQSECPVEHPHPTQSDQTIGLTHKNLDLSTKLKKKPQTWNCADQSCISFVRFGAG